MNFRPCIDLHSGKVKQIVGSTLDSTDKALVENFVSDKSSDYYAKLYKEDNLVGGHVIMLGGGNEEEALNALKAYPNGLQIGGGINDENAAFYLENGASHVIVTSFVFKDGEINYANLDKLVARTGKSRLVLDLSCRKKDDAYFIATDRWQKLTKTAISIDLLDKLSNYCDEFLVHAVDVEGKGAGVDEDLIKLLGQWGKIPITYAGGASSMSDLEKIKELGNGNIDVTIGSSLDIFGGKLSYREVVEWFKKI